MAKTEVYRYQNNADLTISKDVYAKFSYNDIVYDSNRLCGFYPETNLKDELANAGLQLKYQSIIRDARKQVEGIKTATSGRARDTSKVIAV